jgi:transposase
MPNPYPTELRERAVRAYESSDETYVEVAERFAVGEATLQRWVRRQRETGALDPLAKGGGWTSPVEVAVLHALVRERPDRTTDELTRAYNGQVAARARVHRSSILRALQRTGYVFKKNARGRRNTIGPASKLSALRSARGSRR